MKKLFTNIIAFIFLLSGCNVLDIDDLKNYSDDIWDDEVLTSAYLSNLYAYAFERWLSTAEKPEGYTWPRDAEWSDESRGGFYGSNVITVNNTTMGYWVYEKIRSVNDLLQGMETSTLPESVRNPVKGQALFIRAYLYYNMLRLYGGIPIIKEPQALEDDLYVQRNSSLECFNFILQDLADASPLLPVQYTGNDRGRIDQCIVAAFRGRVALLKASPQFNPSSPYDNAYWEEAYTATKAAYDLLEQNGYGLLNDYTAVFETKGHREAVFAIISITPDKENGRGENAVRPLSESKNATGSDQPSWGLAEAYLMKDGKKPGESDKYPYDIQTFWENRDPRFDATIVYNGGLFELSSKTGRRQYTTPGIASSLDAFGQSIQGESHARTGLYCKKGINESLLASQVTTNDYDWLEIRYAEVLFNYTEAANEKNDQSVGYTVLKEIRARAGIEPGTDMMYGLKAGMNKEEMRMALLDEKRIEFSFEGQRFWDLRRHRLLHLLDGQPKYGILATLKESVPMEEALVRADNYTLMPEEFVYQPLDLGFQNPLVDPGLYIPESYYFFPIKKTHLDKNPKLEQNRDWGGSFIPEM